MVLQITLVRDSAFWAEGAALIDAVAVEDLLPKGACPKELAKQLMQPDDWKRGGPETRRIGCGV